MSDSVALINVNAKGAVDVSKRWLEDTDNILE